MWKNDVAQSLEPAARQRFGGLPLRRRNRLNSPAYYFREIGHDRKRKPQRGFGPIGKRVASINERYLEWQPTHTKKQGDQPRRISEKLKKTQGEHTTRPTNENPGP